LSQIYTTTKLFNPGFTGIQARRRVLRGWGHPWGATRRGAVGAEGVESGEGVSPSSVGERPREGVCPSTEKNCTFDSEMTTFLCILTRFWSLDWYCDTV